MREEVGAKGAPSVSLTTTSANSLSPLGLGAAKSSAMVPIAEHSKLRDNFIRQIVYRTREILHFGDADQPHRERSVEAFKTLR